MEKINWKDKVTNEQVLEIVKEKRTLIDVIGSRKKKIKNRRKAPLRKKVSNDVR